MRKTLTVLCLAAIGCGTPPPQESKPILKATIKPVDETRRFPVTDQVSIELVNDKLLGKDFCRAATSPSTSMAARRTSSSWFMRNRRMMPRC